MKEIFLSFARYNQENDKTIYSILSKLSNEERETDRGGYYGSLSALYRHIVGGTFYFQSLFKTALANNAAALKALSPLDSLEPLPEGPLNGTQWRTLVGPAYETINAVWVNLISVLEDGDFQAPVQIEWYGGNPPSVPLFFMLQQLVVHGAHHRGQLSQILDELKIDNDYSGIKVALLPK